VVRRTLNSVDSVSLAFCFFFDYRPRSLASRHKKLNGSFIPIGLNIKRCLFKTDLFITDPALITDHSKPTTFITDPFITDNANMSGLLWTWSVMNGSVMNVVCYERCLLWTGLLWTGLFWKGTISNKACIFAKLSFSQNENVSVSAFFQDFGPRICSDIPENLESLSPY